MGCTQILFEPELGPYLHLRIEVHIVIGHMTFGNDDFGLPVYPAQFHVHGIFRQAVAGSGFAGLHLINSGSIVISCQLALVELLIGILVHPQ